MSPEKRDLSIAEDPELHDLAHALRIVIDTVSEEEELRVLSNYSRNQPKAFKLLMKLLNKDQKRLVTHSITSVVFGFSALNRRGPTIRDFKQMDPSLIRTLPGIGSRREKFINEVRLGIVGPGQQRT